METYFCKMHGTGNDFVMIDDLSGEIELTSEQVRALCDRHFGIGADGVILVRPPVNAGSTAYMHYINADGSLAEMCGNGVRCFAKWLVDRGFVEVAEAPVVSALDGSLVRGGQFVADTLAGPRPITFEVDECGQLTRATVDMGEPILTPELIPTTLTARESVLPTALGDLRFTCVSMGNPHAVTFDAPVWEMASSAFAALGAPLESDTVLFPEKCNIEFAELLNPDVADPANPAAPTDPATPATADLRMRVYERGVGETLACGTGTCAVAVAAVLTGRAGRTVNVQLRGGILRIEWCLDNRVLLTGPAATVYEGTITL